MASLGPNELSLILFCFLLAQSYGMESYYEIKPYYSFQDLIMQFTDWLWTILDISFYSNVDIAEIDIYPRVISLPAERLWIYREAVDIHPSK